MSRYMYLGKLVHYMGFCYIEIFVMMNNKFSLKRQTSPREFPNIPQGVNQYFLQSHNIIICLPDYKGQNTLHVGDKLQQHVAVTDHSLCTVSGD